MEIIKIYFDWSPTPIDNSDYTESYEKAVINEVRNGKTVDNIQEHRAQGEGDRWYYDIIYMDGSIEKTFNPSRVFYDTYKKPKNN